MKITMKTKIIIPVVGAAAIGMGVLFTKGFWYSQKAEADISIGRIMLSELEEQKAEEVQAQIQAVQFAREEAVRAQREAEEAALRAQHEAEAAAQAAADEAQRAAYFEQWCQEANAIADADQFKAIFANSVVVGDSIAYGILQTDLMLSTSVVSQIGGNVYDLEEDIPQVQSLNPQNIFLYVGFNDIGMCAGNNDKYYSDLAGFVAQLQAACPGVPIYVNQLVPVASIEYLGHEEYWDVPYYNSVLQQICSEYGLGFVETNDLVKEEFYYKDGYHMIYPFYPLWLRRMAEVAGLM